MKRILKIFNKECTMTLEMDYTEYIQLMCYITTPYQLLDMEKYQNIAKTLVESIENSDYIVEENTTK